jgi:hypothetical protein
MHSRDFIEFNYYMRREVNNTYGMIELNVNSNEEQKEILPVSLELSQVLVDSLSKPVYENLEVRSFSYKSNSTKSSSGKCHLENI